MLQWLVYGDKPDQDAAFTNNLSETILTLGFHGTNITAISLLRDGITDD